MKTKYNITNFLQTKPMKAEECARLIISSLNEERETGKGFLSQEEMFSIRDGKKDSSKNYNILIDLDQDLQHMTVNAYQNILNYKLLTERLNNIIESYVHAMYQEDVIGCVERLEKEHKGIKKSLNVLKSELKHVFVMNAMYAYMDIRKGDYNLEDLKKADINNSKEVLTIGMQRRRERMEGILAYKELITKGCEKLGISYFLDKLNQQLEYLNKEEFLFIKHLILVDNYFTFKKGEYDGFIKKELETPIEAKYGEDHQSFLED